MKTKVNLLAGFFVMFFLGSCSIKNVPQTITKLSPQAISQMRHEKGYWIEVQIPQRKLILAKGDHMIKTFPIAVGMTDYPTPTGVRGINAVVWNPWWFPPKTSDWVEDPTPVSPRSPDNPLGEIKMPLGQGAYLIHGTKAVHSIGQWASHGCIRMMFEDIFGLVQLLLTNYSTTSAIVQMEKANKNPGEEFATSLNREVPVVLTYEPVKVGDGYVTIYPDIYSQYPHFAEHAARVIEPYLKKDKQPDLEKITRLIQANKNRNIHVSLSDVSL